MAITDFRGKKDRRSGKLYSRDTLNYRIDESRNYAVRRDFNSAIKVLSSAVRDLENAQSLGYLDENSADEVARYAWKNAHMISGLAEDEPEIDNQAFSLIKTLERDFRIRNLPILKKTAIAVSFFSIFIGLFLFSPSLTGNVILQSEISSTNIFGFVFIILGLLCLFYSTRDQARRAWEEKNMFRDRDFKRDHSNRKKDYSRKYEGDSSREFEERE
jgi:hypothetical protein